MIKRLRVLALLLAVLMLCGCQNGNVTTVAPTAVPSGPANYTVKVVDPLGRPMENIGVKFIQGGDQVAMAMADANGVATKELERGDYSLQLSFLDSEHTYYFNADNAKVTATKTEVEIVVAYALKNETTSLSIIGGNRPLYTLHFADGKVTVTGVADASMNGTYAFTAQADGLRLEGTELQISVNLLKNFTCRLPGSDAVYSIVDADGQILAAARDDNGNVVAPAGTCTVVTNEYDAHTVDAGCTYVKLTEAGRTYFLFTPTLAGIYEFSLVGAGTIGSYGTPNFANATNEADVQNNAFRKTITQDMIGTGNTGTTQLVLGIDAESAGETYLCINRVGDPPREVEWEEFMPTYTPSKYTLPAGSTLVDMDLTKQYTLVFNEEDQFYHLNTADGPVVLVRLLSPNAYTGFAFGNILFGSNIGTYHYDENGILVQKVLYNNCIQPYLGTITGQGESMKFTGGMCDDVEGVYPLTKDLETIFKAYGEYMGYWDSENLNYLFADVENLNVEMAWLFACCYVQ